MKTILSILLLIAMSGFHAHGSPLDDRIKEFGDAVQAATSSTTSDPMMAERMTQQLAGSALPGQEVNLEAMVRQIMISNPSKAVARSGQALLDELQARKKGAAR